MIGRRGLRTSFRRLFSSLVRSVGLSCVRLFVRAFAFYLFHFIPSKLQRAVFGSYSWRSRRSHFVLFCFVFFFILTSLQSNSTSKERAARAVNLHCTCKVFPRPQEWLICILSVFDTRTNFQEMASFWGRNNC